MSQWKKGDYGRYFSCTYNDFIFKIIGKVRGEERLKLKVIYFFKDGKYSWNDWFDTPSQRVFTTADLDFMKRLKIEEDRLNEYLMLEEL